MPAGNADLHGYRHFAAMMKYEILALDQRPIATGHNHGLCTVPREIADWARFDQDTRRRGCGDGKATKTVEPDAFVWTGRLRVPDAGPKARSAGP